MGQYILDINKKNWLRFGTTILPFSAMCIWDGKLICGVGATGNYPNLVYADFSKITEKGVETASAYPDMPITSVWRTKNLDFDLPDVEKQVRSVEVVYQDYPDWDNETITVKYRIDQAGEDAVPTWTTLKTISLGSATYNYETKHVTLTSTQLTLSGKFFQFQIETTGHLRINKMIIYYDILSKKY